VLTFSVTSRDLYSERWRQEDGVWEAGSSRISGISHPCLVQGYQRRAGSLRIWVVAGNFSEPTRSILPGTPEFDEAEHVLISIRAGVINVSAGQLGTIPLYLTSCEGTLHASWDICELQKLTHSWKVNNRIAVRHLTRRHRYSSETIIAGIYRLTERATAIWSGSAPKIAYPDPVAHIARAGRLRPGSDPVPILDHVLDSVIRPAMGPGRTGIEVSGGLDSANIATSVCRTSTRRLMSLTLSLEAGRNSAQLARRDELSGLLRMQPVTLCAAEHLPFSPHGPRAAGMIHDPTTSFYLEMLDAMAGRAADEGLSNVFTGFGGDEIMAPHADEAKIQVGPLRVPAWLGPAGIVRLTEVNAACAPVSPVMFPSLMCFAVRNPTYVKHGLWPVSPLAHPAVRRLVQSLPWKSRRNKQIFRDRLRQAGASSDVTDPAVPENFSAMMRRGLRENGTRIAESMTEHSVLERLGLIDAMAWRDVVRGLPARTPELLYDTLALEVGLRAWQETPA
jgi:hypothetical protein